MDHEPSLPTSDDLGITDVEYERIVRDLRRREPARVPIPAAHPPSPVRGHRRALRWITGASLVVVCASVLLPRLAATGDEPAYAFLHTVGGHPVTYSSCHPLQV